MSMSSDGGGGRSYSYSGMTAVALVGRDNEPLYLRSDLCDDAAAPGAPHAAPPTAAPARDAAAAPGGVREGESPAEDADADSSSRSSRSRGGTGLLGRFKGAVGRKNDADGAVEEQEERDDDDTGADDPFGFFEHHDGGTGDSAAHVIPAMSLTQQLVLHASLDRFEESAARHGSRWRMPGSSNAATAMWMGLLCQVEERWNVYGYLTNTGIKFMILVENIYLNPDGSRRQEECAPPLSEDVAFPALLPKSGSREAELKKTFAELHELYVRHTLNPFSKLRSPIHSRTFDAGIVRMARSFNAAALETAASVQEGSGGGGGAQMRGGGAGVDVTAAG